MEGAKGLRWGQHRELAAGQGTRLNEGTAAGEVVPRGPDRWCGVPTCLDQLLGPQLHIYALTNCQVSNFF